MLSDSGQVAFTDLTDPDFREGIWAAGPKNDVLQLVIRQGDFFQVDPGDPSSTRSPS